MAHEESGPRALHKKIMFNRDVLRQVMGALENNVLLYRLNMWNLWAVPEKRVCGSPKGMIQDRLCRVGGPRLAEHYGRGETVPLC